MDIDRKRAYHRKYYQDHKEHLLELQRASDLKLRRSRGIKPRNPGQPHRVYTLAYYHRHKDRINPARNQLRSNRTFLNRGRIKFKPKAWRETPRMNVGSKSFARRMGEMLHGME